MKKKARGGHMVIEKKKYIKESGIVGQGSHSCIRTIARRRFFSVRARYVP